MSDPFHEQYEIDYLTGRGTFLCGGNVSVRARAAISRLNRERARGITEATRPAPSGESISPDRWALLVAARARQWSVPLIPLAQLGIEFDEDGFAHSSTLTFLSEGKEASAWRHQDSASVYKLFSVRQHNATIGQKVDFEFSRDQDVRAVFCDAYLSDTIEKLSVLHDAGACPTELIGLTEDGGYLVAKQPLCAEHGASLDDDRTLAIEPLHAILPQGSYTNRIWVFWEREVPWVLSDLHTGNIRRLPNGDPTIIDALIGPIPPSLLKSHQSLQRAVILAQRKKLGLPSLADSFYAVADDEL